MKNFVGLSLILLLSGCYHDYVFGDGAGETDSSTGTDTESDSSTAADSSGDTESDSESEICGVPDACVSDGTRDAAFQPFSQCSPFNHPMGDGAVYDNVSYQPTSDIWATYVGAWGGQNWADFGCLEASEHLFVVEGDAPSHAGVIQDGDSSFPFQIPDDLVVPSVEFSHTAFIAADRSQSIEVYQASYDGVDVTGSWVVLNPSLTDAGVNLAGPYPSNRGTRAFGGSAMAGVIRSGEISGGIHHAIALKAPPQALNRNGPDGNCFTWPASNCDNDPAAFGAYGTDTNLYMGSLLAIPADADLSFITTPAIMNLARALQDYGGYIVGIGAQVDFTGFPGCWAFVGENAAGDISAVSGEYEQLGRLAGLLQVVTNNGPDSLGGGGAPRTCFAPDLE